MKALVAAALTGYLAVIAWTVFPFQPTADFHQFWGVGAARGAEAVGALPYSNREPYEAALDRLSVSSEKLRAARQQRPVLDPTGTPFFYAVFALLPRDYDAAQAIFLFLAYVCGYAAVLTLARLRGFGIAASAIIAAAVGLTFMPMIVDIRVGNVNSLQLAFIAVFLAMASSPRRRAERENWAMGLFAAWVVFKPNMLLIAAALALRHLWVWGRIRAAMLAAIAFAVVPIAIGAWYFADAAAWTQWARYASRLAGLDPSLAWEGGNQSAAMWLAPRVNSRVPAEVGFFLGLALISAVVLAAGAKRSARVGALTLERAFRDPFFAASFGVLLTFAMSPLVWIHYLVFALIPMSWLVRGHGRLAAAGAIVAYCAMASPVIGFIVDSGARRLLEPVTLLSWTALVPGLLAYVVRIRHEVVELDRREIRA